MFKAKVVIFTNIEKNKSRGKKRGFIQFSKCLSRKSLGPHNFSQLLITTVT